MTRLFAAVLLLAAAGPALAQPVNPFIPPLVQFGPRAALPGALTPVWPSVARSGAVDLLPVWIASPWAPGWYGGHLSYYPGTYFGSPYPSGAMSELSMGYGLPPMAAALQGVPFLPRQVRVDRNGLPLTAPPLQGAGVSSPDVQIATDSELPAELTLEFPAAAEVTLNGAAAKGEGKTRALTSPPLKAGASHTFDVKAKWAADGKKYEWERTVTLGSGERSKVTVARGFPVKD